MKYVINDERLELLKEVWPDGSIVSMNCAKKNIHVLESCLHEMGHVLDATGDVIRPRLPWADLCMCVSQIIVKYCGHIKQDYNELRASVVTCEVLRQFGFLNERLEKKIRDLAALNVDGDFRHERFERTWWLMKNSRRTRRQAGKLVKVLLNFGVVEEVS